MAQLTSTFLLKGGLNIVTPAVAVPSGQCIGGKNYEADMKGYRRVGGFERYDGRPRPSNASYWILKFNTGSATVAESAVVTGATSGATGKSLLEAPIVGLGSFGDGNAVGQLILYDVVGQFQDGENLQVSATTVAVAQGVAEELAAASVGQDIEYRRRAQRARRVAVAKPAGSGPVRGGFVLNGVNYCFRDNAGGTASVLYKESVIGWVAQSLGQYLPFYTGTTAFTEGTVVTGSTSGATATIRRVILRSGAWNGTARGILVLSGITGTFQVAENLTATPGAAVVEGTITPITLAPGGRFQAVVANFYGAATSPRAYFCNGGGRAMEWDGTYAAPAFGQSDDTLDKPTHLMVYQNHLFLGYLGGEITNSELGEPLQFQANQGAGVHSFGSDITDMLSPTSTALVIMGRERVSYFTGTDIDTFVLSQLSAVSGAVPWTAQDAGSPLYLDDAGVRRMSTTQAFGNWRIGTITQAIGPVFDAKAAAGVSACGSIVNKKRDVYRVFFEDGSAVSIFFGRKDPECMLLEYPFEVTSTWTGKLTSDTQEALFVGTADGWVHELDRGTSFDGETVEAYARIAFNGLGSPSQRKRMHKITMEFDTSEVVALSVIVDPEYSSPWLPASQENSLSVEGGGALWDEGNWNTFLWSGQIVGEAQAYVDALGKNFGMNFISEATMEEPHTLSAVTINFSYRGLVR